MFRKYCNKYRNIVKLTRNLEQRTGYNNDGSESLILRNSTLFHAIQKSFHAIHPYLFHATRNLFRATPNMFPLFLNLVCNICKNNFHYTIWSGNLRVLLHVPAKLNTRQINQQLESIVGCCCRKLLGLKYRIRSN